MTKESTLCYIEKDGKYLMLHRTVKENDVNKDKWIGVGGHFEYGESPEECLLREVKEETGYTLTSWKYRGIVTFVYGADTVEYMSLYTADGFAGEPIACDEGDLEWVEKERLYDLELWEGDKIFFRLLDEGREFFSLKLVYDTEDVLKYAALDGIPLDLDEERGKNRKSSGKYAVVFASATGNTALLAEAIRKAEGAEGCVYFGAPSEDLSGRLDGVETIYAGFWTDKGSCSPEMEQFLSTLAGRKVFLFGTAGFGGAREYFDQILDLVASFLPADSTVAGRYMCQGKMPFSVRKRYEAMLEQNPEDKRAQGMIRNFDSALSHPDEADLGRLGDAVAQLRQLEERRKTCPGTGSQNLPSDLETRRKTKTFSERDFAV